MALRRRFVLAVVLCGCGNSGGNAPQGNADLTVPHDMATAPVRDLAMSPARDLAVAGPCDPVKQDCADPNNKCTVLEDPNDPMALVTSCVPVTGMAGLDEMCTRTGDGGATSTAGHDDCTAGFFCSSDGSLVADFSQRHCRRFCTTDQDCKRTPTGRCVGLIPDAVGLCSPTCTLFGKDCPVGLECSLLMSSFGGMAFVATCRGIGKTAAGRPCTQGTDCVAGTDCIDPQGGMNPVCATLCDDNHPCTTGTCARAMGLPYNGGVCQ